MPNLLFQGDNLVVLREQVMDNSVDLIYLDPPFRSQKYYYTTAAIGSTIAFVDSWVWDEFSKAAYESCLAKCEEPLRNCMQGFRLILGETGMLSYLTMMAPRLIELKRVLKSTGSIFIHCDSSASAHLRLMMDALFRGENFLNTIVWCYGLGGSSHRRLPRKHDDILWYSKEPDGHYFDPPLIPATSLKMKGLMKKAPDYWYIPSINNMAKERYGYPTQKPEELLSRIIESASRPGEVVLDPFCGSGTTLAVANKLERSWIGIDSSEAAIRIAEERLLVTRTTPTSVSN